MDKKDYLKRVNLEHEASSITKVNFELCETSEPVANVSHHFYII